ncbi:MULTISPECIES: kynureninase/PvdN C-terminal domain-containing protein [unclassified Sphingomonas]|uniref:kynureninase/PvdN C-terminal domain-containing protein n=1 Tax=unclassified Sphingomonas TaxID=196159 RepID=UPI00083767F1|nr:MULTISPECIES: class V aminotransferase [unclassified Sphingomonas]
MTASYKHLFQRAIAADPERLHFAAHSHHLWPDASYVGQLAAWTDAARLADRKWDRVLDELWPAAQAHVAAELNLPDPATVVFAGNTHDFLVRLILSVPHRPVRILTSDGEFHSFRRQALRWEESGEAIVARVPAGEGTDGIVARTGAFAPDIILVSQVMFGTGRLAGDLAPVAALARPDGPWVVVDGYHGFMAVETGLAPLADRVFYLAGGYKYAMAGEGVAIMHAPPGHVPRPGITGWYAEFEDLAVPPGRIGFAPDARRFMGATFDPSGLYRFVAVRDMLADEGLDTRAITAHAIMLRDQLRAGLPATALGEAEWLNPPGTGTERFMALRHPDAPRWQAALLADGVITDVRGDVLRIGFGLYQTARDVEQFAAILRKL